MSLNYNKIKAREGHSESHWAAYADLFMTLSIIFLLLYVTSNLRSGSFGLQKNLQFQKMQAEAESLRKEQTVYETLKNEYLETKANTEEADTYKELMDKLSLLQEKAKDEKEDLRTQALDNEKKERALNKYQQIIRNIVNANVLAKAGLKNRDQKIEKNKQKIQANETVIKANEDVIKDQTEKIVQKDAIIVEKESVIQDKQKQIAKSDDIIAEKMATLREKNQLVDELNQTIEKKTAIIEDNTVKISSINKNLDQNIQALKDTQKKEKMSTELLNQKINNLRDKSEATIKSLEGQSQSLGSELASAKGELQGANQQLSVASQTIEKQAAEKKGLTDELGSLNDKYRGEIAGLKDGFAKDSADRKSAFDSELAKEKLGAAAKAQKQKAFADQIAKEAKELKDHVADLNKKVAVNTQKLDEAKLDNSKYKDYIKTLEEQGTGLKEDLAVAKNLIEARKKLAATIQNNFKKAGVTAEVDSRTGDVLLSFGDEYFETSKYDLKPKMMEILKKFMPIYSESLLKDKKIAEKIESVEVIGFASPTYKGKYVDPSSLASTDRAAVNYNLDLSYNRAREIFRFIFDQDKITYKYQKPLLPLVKVTGRSFLAEGVKGRGLESGLSNADYCKKFNCKKEQKVIIKFTLDG
jgi:DNA repair exonuclease SbcCD ATPase subunit